MSSISYHLSPCKLHPVSRIKRAEKDRFIAQQFFFLGYLMMIFLDNVEAGHNSTLAYCP